ncbi:ATP-dependent helicase [Brevibacillus agri BAB-2500]|nr:ATP-dependent helicase [Brevibacillus agri BAB-2500]
MIRTREDRGIVSILSPELWRDEQLRKHVQSVFPAGVRWRETLASEVV